jgi:hypothetical protein
LLSDEAFLGRDQLLFGRDARQLFFELRFLVFASKPTLRKKKKRKKKKKEEEKTTQRSISHKSTSPQDIQKQLTVDSSEHP